MLSLFEASAESKAVSVVCTVPDMIDLRVKMHAGLDLILGYTRHHLPSFALFKFEVISSAFVVPAAAFLAALCDFLFFDLIDVISMQSLIRTLRVVFQSVPDQHLLQPVSPLLEGFLFEFHVAIGVLFEALAPLARLLDGSQFSFDESPLMHSL